MNKKYVIGGLVLVAVIVLGKSLFLSKQSVNTQDKVVGTVQESPVNSQETNQVKDNSGDKLTTSSTSKNTVTTNTNLPDPQDIVPGLYTNQIKNTSVNAGLSIVSGLVENNENKDGKAVDDHLELAIKNSSTQDMSNFEVYYTVTDLVTLKKEGYYKKLSGFTLKAGETQAIHFDKNVGLNHYGANKDGLYFTSQNQLEFNVQVSTPEFKIATIKITKDAGGAEEAD